MPGIIAFGRRWLVDTDDLIFLGIFDGVYYIPCLIWCSLKIQEWLFSDGRSFCPDSLLQDAILISFFCFSTIHWLLSIAFFYFCAKGTMCQVEARLPCVTLFRIKTVMNIFSALWLASVSYVIYEDEICKSSLMKQTLMLATLFQAATATAQVAAWWSLFDGDYSKVKKKIAEVDVFLSSTPPTIAYRMKLGLITLFYWFFCLSKEKKNVIRSARQIFGYVSRELDVVYSDFAAGAILMRQKRKCYRLNEELKMNSLGAITLSDSFPTSDMPEWMNLVLAKRYFRFGISEFELRWTARRNIACALRRMSKALKCLLFRKDSCVTKDSCCRSNNASSVQLNSGVPYKDLIHVSFGDRLHTIPFAVTVDTDTSSVVITIGGTVSTNDVLADIITGESSAVEFGCLQNDTCHQRILRTAQRISDRLEDRGILKTAFESRPDYHLVTTGHSLGASIAAVLSLLLRPSHPLVRCLAFEPLPCLGAKALENSFDCIFSIVFGKDVIPYISFRHAEHMVRKVLNCAAECNFPKYKVTLWPFPKLDDDLISSIDEDKNRNFLHTLNENETTKNEKHEKSESAENKNEAEEQKERILVDSSETDEEVAKINTSKKTLWKGSGETVLYIPGRVLHVRSSSNGYRLQIRNVRDFDLPMILPGTILHHKPQHIEQCLEQLGRKCTVLSADS